MPQTVSAVSARWSLGRARQGLLALAAAALLPLAALATETENHQLPVLPAPGPVAIDGKAGDWDLSGGVFACGELEHLRDQFSVWFFAMSDADHVYLLARWQDPTPLNNPENVGGHGFNGDCLQVRFILFPNTPDQTATWWTLWRDAKGTPVADRACPGERNGFRDNVLPTLPQASEQGLKQAFAVNADGKGYLQEIAIPWQLLSASGRRPQIGETFRLTIEPNFTAGTFGRITIKDIFDANVKAPDRVFTFRAFPHWGRATLEAKGHIAPLPVRIADGRSFPVALQDGWPAADWTGLIRKFEWAGFKKIDFAMPFAGYVSLNLINADGVVVRHLLNWDQRPAGPQSVSWDGLTDATYRTPGVPVPAGNYTWRAIAHPGAKLSFRGYASYGGRVPWQAAPNDFWLGDHGVPTAAVTDGERLYLACNGAEGGRHLLATDFQGHYLWGLQNTTGAGDPEFIAVADGIVYVLHPKVSWQRGPATISRVDAKTGVYLPWPGTKNHILSLGDVWPAGQSGPDHFDGLDARAGKLYATASAPRIFNEDVADWKALIQLLQADTPLAKRIMAEVDPETCKRLKDFLAGKIDADRAFATWAGGPRFDREVCSALNGLLPATDLAPASAAKLTAPARALANRRFLEQALAPALKPLAPATLVVLDASSGKVEKTWPLPLGGAVKAVSDKLVYVISGGTQVLAIDPGNGQTRVAVAGLSEARGLTTDAKGQLYVSVQEPDMQVIVYSPDGKESGRIGRRGGRARSGPWQADGLLYPAGVAVDPQGQLWVAERDPHPKRVSVWQLATGKLVTDFFGPTHYGASGSAINPRDPNLMVGVGCEWRLDPQTGKAVCVGTFDRNYHSLATYREGANGKLYLYTFTGDHGIGGVQAWERLGDANYALRAEVTIEGNFRNNTTRSRIWTDANGDSQRQPDELQVYEGGFFCTSNNDWSLNLGPDLTLYPYDLKDKKLKALPNDGFAASGAPRYDLAKLRPMPDTMQAGYERGNSCALPSADNRTILLNLRAKDHPAGYLWTCFDLDSGKLRWTYPNPYYQVHGSHKAPAPEAGLFRGAFGPIGAVSTPGAGCFWIINGNLGEWNALTSDGFYLTRLFNGNVFEWQWPSEAKPGVDLTNLPPGCGGEDFGGSVTQAKDGQLYVQAGKMAIWNVALTGLDQVKPLKGGSLSLSEAETKQALALREQALQAAAGGGKLLVKNQAVKLTGNVWSDFKGCESIDFKKLDDARVRAVAAHDDLMLYLGWEVRDSTPWVNGATDISQMYACGDTVDLQLGSDPKANPQRDKAAPGDLRLSIGNFQGKPTAVLYKFVAAEKKPRTFTSGVVQGYQVDWVDVLAEAKVQVKVEKERYFVEAALPLASLGLNLTPNLVLRGDLGVTHADPSGVRTKLRTYWANQQTGLVDDVVFELQLTPRNWGELRFE